MPLWQNKILATQNQVPSRALQALAEREATYADEVRRLLDAGLDVMRRGGTSSKPRVADIVAAAGLSNEAFYRHFASKDALVGAILADGAERLRSYLAHQMDKVDAPDDKVRRWVEGVLSQAVDPEVAAQTLAVMWNAGGSGLVQTTMTQSLAALLHEPFSALGSADPQLDASLVAHATIGRLSDYLQQGVRPGRREVQHVVDFCMHAVARR